MVEFFLKGKHKGKWAFLPLKKFRSKKNLDFFRGKNKEKVSKCFHDMMQAGVIKQDNNGDVVIVNSEKEGETFDPMNISNLN